MGRKRPTHRKHVRLLRDSARVWRQEARRLTREKADLHCVNRGLALLVKGFGAELEALERTLEEVKGQRDAANAELLELANVAKGSAPHQQAALNRLTGLASVLCAVLERPKASDAEIGALVRRDLERALASPPRPLRAPRRQSSDGTGGSSGRASSGPDTSPPRKSCEG